MITYPVLPAATVNISNTTGCDPWPAGTFTGKAAIIQRGGCEFGVKVLNAEQAGAVFAIVYNTLAGGEELINMGPGVVGRPGDDRARSSSATPPARRSSTPTPPTRRPSS